MIIIILLSLSLIIKLRRIESLIRLTEDLRKSLDEMDEQAKLIVRTDLELNKTYEELDKRLNALYALQKTSQNLSRTLEQSGIFNSLSPQNIQDMGFQKMLLFSEDIESKGLAIKHNIGFEEKDTGAFKADFGKQDSLSDLKEIKATLSSSQNNIKNSSLAKAVTRTTGLDSFIISPVFKKTGLFGFMLIGNISQETPLTAGDEELATILATQIGQALDNAELFENTYSQHQELEKKVIARTKELSDALNEIKKASQRKTDFVSAVSHELRTPLTSIKGYASILLSEKMGALPEELKERLHKINKHSDELVHMVNDLLDIARIESGRFEMRITALKINDLLDEVIDLLSPQFKSKSVRVRREISPGINTISADKTQISRVFINLLSNALKFVQEKTGDIRISAFESAGILQVNVSDNGMGMSGYDCQHIFEEFYRADNLINQKVKGAGLGLSLVKNIISAHKGKIWVESEPARGTTFSFTLPIC